MAFCANIYDVPFSNEVKEYNCLFDTGSHLTIHSFLFVISCLLHPLHVAFQRSAPTPTNISEHKRERIIDNQISSVQ